jgi:hypothetical protein
MEATEEACFSAVTPINTSTAATVSKAAVRRGRKGMLSDETQKLQLKGALRDVD